MPDLRGGRVGEASREGLGELATDEEADRFGTVGVVVDRFEAAGDEDGGLLSAVPVPRASLPLDPSFLPSSELGFSAGDAMTAEAG